jgi:hypothetical protein
MPKTPVSSPKKLVPPRAPKKENVRENKRKEFLDKHLTVLASNNGGLELPYPVLVSLFKSMKDNYVPPELIGCKARRKLEF